MAKPMIFGKNPKDFKQKFKQNGCFQINLGQRQSITRSAAPAKSRTVNPGDANPYDSEKSFDLHSAGTLEPPRLTILVKKNDTCTKSPLGCCFRCMVGDRNQNHSRNVLRQINLGQFSLNSAFSMSKHQKNENKTKALTLKHMFHYCKATRRLHTMFLSKLVAWSHGLVLWRLYSFFGILARTTGSRNHVSSPVSQLFFPCKECLCCFFIVPSFFPNR